ncbi:MAG: tRNA (adenosine(37)-N6)-dimethylallyltransferase MiaA [Proteobacteria bacterium]|nr:tRNA (adenosine(37)-N6)-dimethylallyltransferase MiaA [Pseudomonadota bacterium]
MVDKFAKTLVIFGPTACGKTALSLDLAEALGGEVINADSRQVYRHMPIISACPSAAEYARAVHHLFEFLEPGERFSAARWAELAREKIDEVRGRGKVPIVVGGTGFYLRVLLEGVDAVPEIPAEVEDGLAGVPVAELYKELQAVDPVLAAKLKPADTQRIVRGLVVWRYTRVPLSGWQKGTRNEGTRNEGFLKVGIRPDRAWLHARIAARWEQFARMGVVGEVRRLRELGYGPEAPALRGLAIPDFFAHIDGEVGLEEVLAKAVVRDRQYAKRQYTWLNNSYGADQVFDCAEAAPVLRWIASAGA